MPEETIPVSLIGEDGLLVENFAELLPEDIRTEETLKTMPRDIPNLIKMTVNAQKKIGKNKVALPGEKATEAELSEFYSAIGRPETPQDYGEYKKPEGLDDSLWDSDRIERFKAKAHSLGLTKKQAEGLLNWDSEELVNMLQKTQEADAKELAKVEESLKQKMGMAYEQNVHNVNILFDITNNDNEERKAAMIAKYGRDPLFIEWASEISKQFIEHEIMPGELGQMTPKDALAEINILQNTEGYMSGELKRKDPIKHKQIYEKIMDLNKIAYAKAG